MKIAITGSTSTIGCKLLQELRLRGFDVIPFGGRSSEIWRIGSLFPSEVKADVLVHLAHDRKMTFKESIEATENLCGSFPGKVIFLSSLSAHSRAISNYGKCKYAMEGIVAKSGGISLRAGIVYGESYSGIFRQIARIIQKYRVIPLIYGGKSITFTTHIDDLISEIINSLQKNSSLRVFAANASPVSLKDIFTQMARKTESKRFFLPIPRQPFDFLVQLIVKLLPRIPLGDSMLSLSRQVSHDELSQLSIPQTRFRDYFS